MATTNGSFAQQEQYKSAGEQATSSAGSIDPQGSGDNNLSKDEVGWYFVEQYYTTLSKTPEKLHLFYSKRSQFVYGREAEVANVSVGRQAIQERIKQLDFHDCKVRVSNVDSQASFENIVIQVIGETSNKASEPKKFVQTFVLAQQPSGYFVLNDILRYVQEGDDETAETTEEPAAEEPAAEVAAPAEPEPAKAEEPSKEEADKVDEVAVDEKLQDAITKDGSVNGVPSEAAPASVAASETKSEAPTALDPEKTAQEIADEDVKQPEKPKDPVPTPALKPADKPAETAPAEPAAPPKPMTWASRAAAAAGPRPVVPLPKTATPPATSQTRAPAPAAAATAATTTAAAPAAPAAPVTAAQSSAPAAAPAAAAEPAAAKDSAGWQTAGADSKRQRPQSMSAPAEKEGTLGYVRYVTEKVQDADLRAALAVHGELAHFDINRMKNCAFVEFKTAEGYQAAISSNPHVVNGENIVVEPRKHKAANYGGSYGAGRGGMAGRGRGGFDNNRGNARGNYSGQNRGRGGAPRGRGGAQASA
jgi:hypothetical protein